MESTGVGVVVFLVLLFAPALQGVLKSIAFRLRAAGKAEMMRAEGTSDKRAGTGCPSGKRGRRG
ncbi:hypothetical protein [Streptomyces diastatochromogenes]|uniref:hypothetical protein n=1 Tax=Streptomyces diastatochromogenes TaxID=42236 RepID=UPI00367E9CD5